MKSQKTPSILAEGLTNSLTLRNVGEHLDVQEPHCFDPAKKLIRKTRTPSLEEQQLILQIPAKHRITEESGTVHSLIEHMMTYSFPLVWIASFYFSIDSLAAHNLLWTIAIALPVAWILADFVTGFTHWFADTYGSEDTPVLGKLIQPFRLHHIYPRDICKHDLVLTIGNSCMIAVPVLGLLLFLTVRKAEISAAWALGGLSLSFLALAAVATNLFHRWAHADETNAAVRTLQRWWLILPKPHHDLHHSAPFDTNYCITAGWLNSLLESLRFFRGMERVLTRIGLEPAKSCLVERAAVLKRSTRMDWAE